MPSEPVSEVFVLPQLPGAIVEVYTLVHATPRGYTVAQYGGIKNARAGVCVTEDEARRRWVQQLEDAINRAERELREMRSRMAIATVTPGNWRHRCCHRVPDQPLDSADLKL